MRGHYGGKVGIDFIWVMGAVLRVLLRMPGKMILKSFALV
jgi:hypothetical protein